MLCMLGCSKPGLIQYGLFESRLSLLCSFTLVWFLVEF